MSIMDNQKNIVDILLIEDNPIDALIIQEMLAQAKGISFKVEVTALLKKGLERLADHDVDLILTDITLPDSKRTETFEKVYAHAHDIPIIVMSSHDDEDFAVRAIQAGAQDYLVKGQVGSPLLTRAVRYAIERNRSEKALRKSKQEWERTFNAIDDIITILDPNMRIMRTNQAAVRAFKTEELIGKHCHEVFANETERCPICPMGEVIRKNNSFIKEIEHVYLGKTFLVAISPIFDEHDTLMGFVHVAKDISYKKKIETQLRQAQRLEAIATLAGGIAHDLNNILFPIYGYAEMTLELAPDDVLIQKNLKRVLDAAERGREMVQQILTFSREGREGKKSRYPCKIQSVIKETLKLLRGSVPATIDIRRRVDETCGRVMADPTQIHQVLMNLCTNAYHAMREKGGVLEISLHEVVLCADETALDMEPGPCLKLSVSDTGHGMERAVMDKIFDPYFTTKDVHEGTGLGLSVTHGIVKGHKGHITVYSELGRGTTFHVYLPLADRHGTDVPKDAKASALPTGDERILLVDDEETITEMLGKRLKRLGYQVTAWTSSPDALAAFRRSPQSFDLVITDMTMPNMTGIQLSRSIRTIRPDIPIILCSGFSELLTEEKIQEVRIQGYMMKPVPMKEMADIIRQALDTKT